MITLAIAAVAVVYLGGWRRLHSTSPDVIPPWRAGGFLIGLVAIWSATASSLAACDADSLTAHMVQHLLLMTVAPPLIFLGEPFLTITGRRSVEWAPMARAFKWLAHPALCWLAATMTLMVWHVPAAFTLALRSHAWHAVEHASFLGTGLLFWWPVVPPWPSRPEPRWSLILYLFLATLPCDILSGFLVFSDRIVYPAYLSTQSALAVLEDQQRAGAVMWTSVTIIYLVAGVILSTRLLTCPSPRERLAEAV